MAETPASRPEAVLSEPDLPRTEAADEQHGENLYSEFESTEMGRLRSQYSHVSTRQQRATSTTATQKPESLLEHLTYSIHQFWRHQVSVVVPHDTSRDHLALERTFLGYLRTSLALSMMGITVAQLFRIQHSPTPSPIFGFYVLGKPLSCICQGAAIYTLAIGAFRQWRTQNAIVRGKAISGGTEILLLAGGIFAIILMFFVVLVAVDVDKEYP